MESNNLREIMQMLLPVERWIKVILMVVDLNNVNNEPNALKVSSSPAIMETQTQKSIDITISAKEQENHITEDKIQSFINVLPEYPLHSHGLINAPKVLADVVESTIGAVFIDSNSSIDTTLESLCNARFSSEAATVSSVATG
ncbi:hypothetical protein K7X08_025208 [Anisodus acutangulus]|uniref:RNase III domain-containing protein n=1 Tax=Anisodus acutangulus TaxID=402998 RepID=A0A9Q1MEB0_9SOLA|nr:hypothetical protein K7X08_025208 [Anisodus acutangulus]